MATNRNIEWSSSNLNRPISGDEYSPAGKSNRTNQTTLYERNRTSSYWQTLLRIFIITYIYILEYTHIICELYITSTVGCVGDWGKYT